MKSVDWICEKLTEDLIQSEAISSEDRELYIYCFNTIVETAMNLIGVLILGALLGQFVETVVLIGVVMGVRPFAGGYHAKTTGACFLLSELSYFLILFLNYISRPFHDRIIVLALGIVLAGVVYLIGPVSCETKVVTKEEYPFLKRRLALSLLIATGCMVLFSLIGRHDLEAIVVICYAYILLLELLGGEGRNSEKDV